MRPSEVMRFGLARIPLWMSPRYVFSGYPVSRYLHHLSCTNLARRKVGDGLLEVVKNTSTMQVAAIVVSGITCTLILVF